ncbi:2-amino-4-hydroxy-6-hydroxymethyldihydropteridine diphosphokinase [Sphingobacterium corticis]|uniref:2-amino-4-hydroxy-6-hydroxymethyldihydropteridine pyrophosphokinase n=1 Tax=Sphingobacterium corticis TaxID=1812823 RepID=A0ABW5NE56_9SPHI
MKVKIMGNILWSAPAKSNTNYFLLNFTGLAIMNSVYILLGANLGDPHRQLENAVAEIEKQVGKIVKRSSIYESEAWGVRDQPTFLNQVLVVETAHKPLECLHICQDIEQRLGRVRERKWGARVIDIDLLYFNDEVMQSDELTIPHPYIQERNFTLIPLNEISPNYVHPKLNQTNYALLQQSADQSTVNIHHE